MNKRKLGVKMTKKIKTNVLLEDKVGEYVPFCDFQVHRGVIKRNYTPTCIARNCRHYQRLYVESGGRHE